VKFKHVRLVGIGVTLPSQRITSDDIELRLAPLYERLKLPPGRLELMSGISSRRIWEPGTVPSGPSIESGNAILDQLGWDRNHVGCLIHASVCRDFLEPATASKVHHGLQLPSKCWVYDVSNACLGIMNGAVQIAGLIESGAIQSGIVVGTENSRPLLESTIAALNGDMRLTRQSVKPAFASLTIGSGSCAWLLAHEDIAPNATQFLASVAEARTAFHDLCRSDEDAGGAEMQPIMDTDSEKLLHEGIATGVAAMEQFLPESGWSRDQIDRTVCHQVGGKHRAMMLESLGLDLARDTATFPWLGNTGSVALPMTLAVAAKRGDIQPGNHVAMLGIGSGINSVMVAAKWNQTAVAGNLDDES
jgi:acyl-CoA:acyl-CoA alkyltransferase